MLGVTVTIFKRKALENVIHSFFYSFIHLFMYLCIDVSAALHWRTNSVVSSQSALFGCPHTSGRVVQPVCDVSMVSSLSLSPSLCRSCGARSPLWPDDSIQICVLFRRGLRVVRSLLHAAWDKPLSWERERERTSLHQEHPPSLRPAGTNTTGCSTS